MLILQREWELPGVLKRAYPETANITCPHQILCTSLWMGGGILFCFACSTGGLRQAAISENLCLAKSAARHRYLLRPGRVVLFSPYGSSRRCYGETAFDTKISGARNISLIWARTTPWADGILPFNWNCNTNNKSWITLIMMGRLVSLDSSRGSLIP